MNYLRRNGPIILICISVQLLIVYFRNQTEIASRTRWILRPPEILADDGSAALQSQERLEFFLLLRKLLLFGLRELNLRIKNEDCAEWWANPLSVSEVVETKISAGLVEYILTFEAQPGRIPFQTTLILRQNLPDSTHAFASNNLWLLDGRRLDSPALDLGCESVKAEIRSICLCKGERNTADKLSLELRRKWNETDKEISSWPPNVPMFVEDYIKYDSTDLYLRSPLNPTAICGPSVKMIIFITSAPSHSRQRCAIRSTYGNFKFLESHRVKLLFVLGRLAKVDSGLQAEIDEEFSTFNDIVEAGFVDSYENLTLKHLSLYNWVVTHCGVTARLPPWILKADDDVFINVPMAVELAEANPDVEMMGHRFCVNRVHRSPESKYYTPRYMQMEDAYVRYLGGVAHLVRTDIIKPMLEASISTPLLHMEDVYVSGMLRMELGITEANSPLFVYGKENPDSCHLKRILVSSFGLDSDAIKLQWTKFQEPARDCPLLSSMELRVKTKRLHEESEPCSPPQYW